MRQTLLILTAGMWQLPVIRTAKSMGLRVIVTDRDPAAPGLPYADIATVIDTRDRDGILALARRHGIDGVIAEQTDVGVAVAASVAEEMALPGIGVDAALAVTNKFVMRERCRAAGIPTPRYRRVFSAREAVDAAGDIGFPVVVKPVDAQSSRGVAKLESAEQVASWFPRASEFSSDASAMVEEMMRGTESSIEAFVAQEAVSVFGICEKTKSEPPYSFDLRLIYPASFPSTTMDEVVALNQKVIRAVGIEMGITHAEYIITPAGPRLLEIAARGCGAGVATRLIPAMTGVDLIKARIGQALGLDVSLVQTRSLAGLLQFLMLPSGILRRLDGVAEARTVPGVIDLDYFVKPGERIRSAEHGGQRPGTLLAVGDERSDLMRISREVHARLRWEVSGCDSPRGSLS